MLTVTDTFSRFSPVLDPRLSDRVENVVAALDRVCAAMGYPKTIRIDQDLEFVLRDLDQWANAAASHWTSPIPASRPTSVHRSFQRAVRTECLIAR